MKLQDYRETYYEFSGTASEISRKLAFAGIALVWLFKIESTPVPKIPEDLVLPIGLLTISLAFDLFQYVFASAIWGIFQYYQERKLSDISDNPTLSAPSILKFPQFFFFWSKLAASITAYVLIVKYILTLWVHM